MVASEFERSFGWACKGLALVSLVVPSNHCAALSMTPSSHQSAVKAPWLPLNTLVSPPSCTWQWLALERDFYTVTEQCDVTPLYILYILYIPFIYCQKRSALVVSPQHSVTLSSHSNSTQCPAGLARPGTRVTHPPPAFA